MSAPVVIGLLGKKRSGKDTFAERLVERHGFQRFAFADALKATMLDLNPWVRVELDETGPLYSAGFERIARHHERLNQIVDEVGWEAAKEMREVRRLLQEHGVAMRNHVDPGVWVNAVGRAVAATDRPVVITDVRFPNEIDFVARVGGYAVRIVRPDLASSDQHVSETALDDVVVPYTVVNSSTIESLHRDADVTLVRIAAGILAPHVA